MILHTKGCWGVIDLPENVQKVPWFHWFVWSVLPVEDEAHRGEVLRRRLRVSLDLDDVNDLDTDFEYDGIYFNGYYNF